MGTLASEYLDRSMTEQGLTNAQVAALCSTTSEAVRLWRKGARVPQIASVKLLAKTYAMEKHRLRPDVWDAPRVAKKQAPSVRPSRPVAVTASVEKTRSRVTAASKA